MNRRARTVGALAGFVALAASPAAIAATLQVGPGKTYATPCAAIAAAQAGDTIEVDAAGSYAGDTCAWSTDNLTVRGVNGRAKIDATNTAVAQQKGIFVIAAPNATIENFELSNAAISAGAGNNGAGIRHQGLNLTVRNCFFHDNQNGILGSPSTDGQGEVLIEGSEFSHNGAGDGFSHNMYLGHYAKFTLHHSYSHRGNVGHLVKTRAYVNFVMYSRITDETGGTASYEIDVPNAGTTYVIGNVIEQSATTQNPAIIAYGEEGATNPDAHLFVVNNTILNDNGAGTFVSIGNGSPASIVNNVFTGGGTITAQAAAAQVANFSTGNPMFVNQAAYDVHLAAGSPCIDQGSTPGMNGSQSLSPDHEYAHPLSQVTRAIVGTKLDIGAYEFGNAGTLDGGANDSGVGDGGAIDGSADASAVDGSLADGGAIDGGNGATSGDSSGCGCGVASGASDVAPACGVLALCALFVRRKRRAVTHR